ncbi:hypothetical protein DRN38_06670 [Thermococci archaeon]|nr:MAG: hypothetical protein DRN38_06670 [Thermococci archaeon]
MRYVSAVLAIICFVLLLGLNASFHKISELESQLAEKEEEIALLRDELNQTKGKLLHAQEELNQTKTELKELKRDYYILKKHPTFAEVKRFVEADSTITEFIRDHDAVCYHYALAMQRHAIEHGLFASIVVIRFKEHWGHAIVAFNTSDRGIVYVEPQCKLFVNITLGKDYFKGNGLKSILSGTMKDYAHFWDYKPKGG